VSDCKRATGDSLDSAIIAAMLPFLDRLRATN
jgi:hypothetical protein